MGATAVRNVQTVEALYEAERNRDIDAWGALWSTKGRQIFCLANPQDPVIGRDELIRMTTAKFAERPPYSIEVTVDALADPAKVLARLRLRPVAAASPTTHVWCVFCLDEDGRILELTEIADTGVPSAGRNI